MSARLGCAVAGVFTANYSGGGRAQVDSWAVFGNFDEWQISAPIEVPNPTDDLSFGERIVEWAPNLGGWPFVVGEPGGNRIIGCRIVPPVEDPRVYIRNVRAAMNADPSHAPRIRLFDSLTLRMLGTAEDLRRENLKLSGQDYLAVEKGIPLISPCGNFPPPLFVPHQHGGISDWYT